MDLGDDEPSSLFLLKGNLLLEAADGRKRIIKHTDASAHMPLSRLRPSRYRISALTPVHYIKISNALLDELRSQEEVSEMLSSHYRVEEISEENADFSTQMVSHIYEDLDKNSLLLLSWNRIALSISREILAQSKHTALITEWAMLDPVLSLKLMKAAQFHHRPGSSVPNVTSAISQLGSQKTVKLAFMNLFRESRNPHIALMQEAFRSAWERSISVAASAKLLAQKLELKDPAEAELIGLFHNIGEISIISYAYNSCKGISQQDLQDCILMYGRETGRMVLSHWNIFHSLAEKICDTTNWLYDHGDHQPNLTDIVIAARACVQITQKDGGNPPPPLPQIPALKKLKLDTPNSLLATDLRAYAEEHLEIVTQKLGI